MANLLVLTTGQTDVQLVVTGDDGNLRQELNGPTCGILHDEIAKRVWSVVDSPAGKAGQRASRLPDGELALCTPKLDAVLNYFTDELRKPPSAALILETRRTIASDPRFAGAVLERRLRDKGVRDVERHAFLNGEEGLDDQTNDLDAVVRRSVVEALSMAIGDAIQRVKPTQIVAATIGGFPPANAVIEECIRLYAVAQDIRATVLEVPDAARAGQVDRAVGEKFHPAAGYRARWQALSFIQKGNLLAAWGAIEHIRDAPGQDWTKVIEWLASFASSLPIPEDCDIPVLKHPRMAVRAALRVELALRAGDIPRAVHGTVSFFEAALWDHLLDRFERTGRKHSGLEILRRRPDASPPAGPKLLRNDQSDEREKRNCPFERFDDGTYVFFEDGAGRFARDYVKSSALKELTDAINKVRDLRNDVAHNEPTPALMNDARERMLKAGLWAERGQFLAQEIVQNVLKELGVVDPSRLCDDLIEIVRDRLLGHRLGRNKAND